MAVTVLYALAAALFGFLHISPRAQADDLSAYTIPGAIGPVICHGNGDKPDDLPGDLNSHVVCQACLVLAGGGLLPPSVHMSRPAVHVARVVFIAPFDTRGTSASLYEHRSRAPPAAA